MITVLQSELYVLEFVQYILPVAEQYHPPCLSLLSGEGPEASAGGHSGAAEAADEAEHPADL